MCAKCRSSQAVEGDTWCIGCTAWEGLGRELTAHWDCPGARRLADDLVVSTARQLRALRSLTAGLTRDGQGTRSAGTDAVRRGERTPVPEPAHPPRHRRKSPSIVKEKAKEEPRSDQEDDEEEEEESEDPPLERKRSHRRSPDHRPLGSEKPRSPPPPDKDYLPGTTSLGVKLSQRDRSRGRGESRREHRDRDKGSEHRSRRKPHRRGGRNHKRLARLATNPLLRVHRAPGRSFWELSAERPRCLELDQLGR